MVITEEERKEVIATVVSIATKELFKNHLYSFGGKVYKQAGGGAIGLRARCAIACVTMNVWDAMWTQRLEDINIRKELYTRYMDDGRTLIHPIRPGWRFCMDGRLKFCKKWEEMDLGISTTERTKRVLEGTMQGLMEGLVMTMETKDDFCGEWLPTLDVKIAISATNRLKFTHFEKPTCSNLTLQMRSAMEQNTKMSILGNEVMRRMMNIGGDVGDEVRRMTIDDFAVKIITSGYGVEQTRRIILGGIRGYEAKVRRRLEGNIPLYRTAEQSSSSRSKKKILGKSTWFKGGKKSCSTVKDGGKSRRGKPQDNGEIKTRSVIFVEHTREGGLAKKLREQLGRLESVMGFRLKVVERSGTQIKDLFSLTNIWGGIKCGREECITCTQGGDDLPDCTRRSILYESICTKCNPGAKEPGPLKSPETEVPSIYVGESSRSIFERAGEHWKAYVKRDTDSHIWKHHIIHHGGEGEPEMRFKVVGTYRSALARQVAEAVRIRGRGTVVLNSKGEYNRSRIHRLTIGTEEHHQTQLGTTPFDGVNRNKELDEGERFLMNRRKDMDRNNTGTRVTASKSTKRGNNGEIGTGRQNKKRKFVLIGEDWGNTNGNKSTGIDCTIEEGTRPLKNKEGGTLIEGMEHTDGGGGRNTTMEQTEGRGINNKLGVGTEVTSPLIQVMMDGTNGKHEGGNITMEHTGDGGGGGSITMEQTNNEGGGIQDKNVKCKGVTSPLQGTLYDTANNISILRNLRGDCKGKGGSICQEHGGKIKQLKRNKEVWTRNAKTGLYGYRKRKITVLRCDGCTENLVGTMGAIDGASNSSNSMGY